MSAPAYDAAYYADLLYRLLPNVYRARDTDAQLRTFLALFGGEFARLRANMDQLWRDFYIDTCQDWVVPYIADLVSTNIVFNDAARNRLDVKKTMHWRRRKGTLAGLEDLAADIYGSGAYAAEMFERLIWNQNLNHVRPAARQTLDLAQPSRLARLHTPFDASARTVDLRVPDGYVGRHHLPHVAFYEWALGSYPRRNVEPTDVGDGRFRFDPLGRDVPLYAGGDRGGACAAAGANPDTRADACNGHADNFAIRGRDFEDNPAVYFGQPLGFALYEDGILLCAPGTTAPAIPSIAPNLAYTELSRSRGIVAADTSVYGATAVLRIEAVRLGAVIDVQTVIEDGVPKTIQSPVAYSPALPLAAQLAVRAVQATLDIDATGPTFTYTKGLRFNPGADDYHYPALLLRVTAVGAALSLPASEIIIANDEGEHLLVYLPAVASLAAGAQLYLYVADDGSTYYARGDHAPGAPDRNPDTSVYGAFATRHLAAAALGQVRPRPGHPATDPYRVPVYRRLCCWDQPLTPPLAANEVAFDPERGRFRFPADPATHPVGTLTVDFRFAFTGEVGAGPFVRDTSAPPTLTVAQAKDADFPSIQAAINAAPQGSLAPVIIEVGDSRTYEEGLVINAKNYPGGITIRAAALETPIVRKPGTSADLVRVQGSTVATLVLDGLLLTGGVIDIAGAVAALRFEHCSLDPASATLTYAPSATGANFALNACISGPVTLTGAPDASVTDSIVQHPAATIEQPGGHTALDAGGANLVVEGSTVFGDTAAARLTATNALHYGAVALSDAAGSCLRYSRVPAQPADARRFNTSAAVPIFQSLRFGDPGYMHLHPNSTAVLRRGAENGGEMGAFYQTGIPWREQNVGIKLAEYLPAGLRAVPVRVLPARRHSGAIPL